MIPSAVTCERALILILPEQLSTHSQAEASVSEHEFVNQLFAERFEKAYRHNPNQNAMKVAALSAGH